MKQNPKISNYLQILHVGWVCMLLWSGDLLYSLLAFGPLFFFFNQLPLLTSQSKNDQDHNQDQQCVSKPWG